jgi:hypothetical protein
MDREAIDARLAEIHQGPWILATDVAAGATRLTERFRGWGNDEVLVVAASEGAGELPLAREILYTRASGPSLMQGLRAYLGSIEEPSGRIQAAVDAFDPGGKARVVAPPFGGVGRAVGRPVYGASRPEWAALEDKMIVDEVWDAAGVPRAPSEVVTPEEAPVAARRLGGERGTVWVADNREGWHGGGDYARWVPDAGATPGTVRWFAEHAGRVRVMPFLDGVPCSIHGFVTRDGVAALRPMEMLIFRRPDAQEFLYAGWATFWDPPGRDREQMRDAVRRVGHLLAERVGYLGAFGVDGVLTSDGFLPTELNPRLSAGHGSAARAADIPLGAMARAFVEGDLELEAADLEETLLAGADRRRMGGMRVPIIGEADPATTLLAFEGGVATAVDDEDRSDARMSLGNAPLGGVVVMDVVAERIPHGESFAPRAQAAIDLARELWELDIPQVEPAMDVRS